MTEEGAQRRLAAILVADVEGYSRLMGKDEEGTLAALTRHRTELIEPCVAEHRGRVVKTTGDGLLAEFSSVVEGVRCAIAIQEGMQERNREITEEYRIEFRIGVNLGDVIVQDDDVFGDGVNVAARLEGLAKPGHICISGNVHEQVVNRLEVGFADLGPQRVKNIKTPVHVYQLLLDPSAAGRTISTPHSSLDLDRPVICFVDDDPMEVGVFQRVFGDQYQVFASTSISEVEKQVKAASVSPNLIVLDLYFPSGRESTESERIEMIRLKQNVDDAQQALTTYLSTIGQGRDGGLQLLVAAQQKFPGSPITFFTRKGTIDDVVACLDAGALHVLKKPQPTSVDTDGDITEQMEAAARDSKQYLSVQFDRLMSSKGLFKKLKEAIGFVKRNWARF